MMLKDTGNKKAAPGYKEPDAAMSTDLSLKFYQSNV